MSLQSTINHSQASPESQAATNPEPKVNACCLCTHYRERAFCDLWSNTVPKYAQWTGCDQFQYDIPF